MGIWYGDQPYTSFANVNAKRGRVRLTDGEGGGYSAVIQALSLSGNATLEVRDATGSIVVSGSDLTPIGNTNLLSLDTINITTARTVGFRNVAGSLFVGLAGTMSVDLSIIAACEYYATAVTITGLTSNDAITWGLMTGADNAGSLGIIPLAALAAANTATLIFGNVNAASIPSQSVVINYVVTSLAS